MQHNEHQSTSVHLPRPHFQRQLLLLERRFDGRSVLKNRGVVGLVTDANTLSPRNTVRVLAADRLLRSWRGGRAVLGSAVSPDKT